MSEKIPFDIEKWETGNYEAVYRDGKIPLEVFVSKRGGLFPVISIDMDNDVLTHRKDGLFNIKKGESLFDLFLTPKKKKGWVVTSEKDGNVHDAFFKHDANIDNYKKFITAEGYNIVHEAEFEY